MGSQKRSFSFWNIRTLEWVAALSVVIVSSILVADFLRAIPFPVGDDPGLHSTLIGGLIRHQTTDFEIPIFPQVHTPFPDRSATAILGWKVANFFQISDPLVVSVLVAATLFAISAFVLFWLGTLITGRPLAAAAAALFWGWSHWGQEVFWEGGYDQITSLPIFFGFLICLWLAFKKRSWIALLMTLVLAGALYYLHQLSFFTALVIGVSAGILWLKGRVHWVIWLAVSLLTLAVLGFVFAATPAYFPLIKTGQPLYTLLTASEGVYQLLPILMVLGLGVLLLKKQMWATPFILVPILLSQAGLLGFGFYPFRFNVYAFAGLGLLLGLALTFIFEKVENYGKGYPLAIFFLLLYLATPLQQRFDLSYRVYLTNEVNAPASILLQDTYKSFIWIRDHIPGDANFAAPYKWGYYLAAVTGKQVTLNDAVGGDARDNRYPYAQLIDEMYTTPSVEVAITNARLAGVSHVLVDASFTKYPDRYPHYQFEKFNDRRYFRIIYQQNDVKIYEIVS